ncbi:MAG: hypothetical protein ACJ8M1_14655 [Chthoniobacterales bacterium]
MPLSISSPAGKTAGKARPPQKPEREKSDYIVGEINAFIAIRDELLVEAEEAKTASKLDSLLIANNFVESCLSPAKSPYDVQFLPEPAAKRERKRCDDVKRRIENLRDQLHLH